MKQIKIKSISLLNFKGIRNLTVQFKDMTIISGENKSGKTSLFDAFTWLLFGKDSYNRSDFNIKTLDQNNIPIPQIEHEVTAVFQINDYTVELRKVYKEKWTKKRGAEKAEMTGHTTDYYYNEVPLNEREYTEKIDDIITEKMFKMLTSPSFFNSMKWQERRMALTEMVGDITNEEIAGSNMEFILLLEQLNGKTMDEYRREITAKKKLLKEDIERIPIRIDEATHSMPQQYDYGQLEIEIQERQNKIEELLAKNNDEQESYKAKNSEIKKILDGKLAFQQELMRLKNDNRLQEQSKMDPWRASLKEATETLRNAISQRDNKNERLKLENHLVEDRTITNDRHREEWKRLNEEQFVPVEMPTHCATCTQPLPQDQVEAYRANAEGNYNRDKQTKLSRIQSLGKANNAEIEQAKIKIETLKEELAQLEIDIDKAEQSERMIKEKINQLASEPISKDPREEELERQIEAIAVPNQIQAVDSTQEERRQLTREIDERKQKLTSKKQLEAINNRIAELEEEQQLYAQQLANLEKAEHTMEQFNKIKMDQMESKINGKFKLVKWRLFQAQINGATEECCDCLVEGVPINDVNTAGRINAGIDIVNALIEHNNVSAPIWIDNCESVNEVLPSRAQMVLLYVNNSKLTIS